MALPNLRRLFVEARTEAEENEYSRNAVSDTLHLQLAACLTDIRWYSFTVSLSSQPCHSNIGAFGGRQRRLRRAIANSIPDLVLFISSVAVFSLVAQRMSNAKAIA